MTKYKSGAQLLEATKNLFKTDTPTKEQLTYVINMASPINYALAYHTANNHPITFDVPGYDISKAAQHRPWQKEILKAVTDTNNKDVVIIKARQLGLSEVAVMAIMYLADYYSNEAINFLYSFPTYRQVNDFKKGRIDTQISNGYYSNIIDKNNNSLSQMSIRNSRIYFRTASKASAVEGVNLDGIFYDEFERYAGTNGEESGAQSLKGNNRMGIIRRWSTPSVPDFGTDRLYRNSNQNVWLTKCEHCNKWQEIKFEENLKVVDEDLIDRTIGQVKPGATRYECKYCHKSLEASRWYNGQWVTKYPSRISVGFDISQLNAVWISSDQIYSEYLKSHSRQTFSNYVLGEAYQDSSLQITSDDIINNMRKDVPTDQTIRGNYRFISAGIDWGAHFHHLVVIGCRDNGVWDIIHLQQIAKSVGIEHIEEDLRQVIMVLNQFDPDIILPDLGYNGNYVDKLKAQFGLGKVYGVQTRSARTNNDMNAHFNDQGSIVTIDKLMQNIQCIEEIKAGRLGMFGNPKDPNFQTFITHWKNVIISDEQLDNQDGDIIKVIKRRDADHFAQACVYAYVGMKKLINDLQQQNQDVQVADVPMSKVNFDDSEGFFETNY
ncbi:MAG: phage terminase large subunit family protein [Lactobacillus sp.]|nr:phage terminase large subunit family protein [Lactobacillus sp.]